MPAPPRRRTLPLLAALALAAGSAGAAPPPSAPPSAAPTVPAAPPPQAAAAPPAKEPSLPALAPRPATPPLDEALPPLTRSFARVQMKGVKEPFIAVGGRGPRDVLFLTEESFGQVRGSIMGGAGIIYRSDGERVVERMVPCGHYSFSSIVASRDEIVLDGHNMWFRGVPGRLWSSFAGGGAKRAAWECSRMFRGGFAVASGGQVWRYECSYAGCAVTAPGLPEVPLPEGAGNGEVMALWMRAADDGWVIVPEGDGRSALFRYNGVAWTRRASLDDLEAREMWGDGDGHLWILAHRGAQKGQHQTAANAVLRFDGRTLVEVAVPRGFAASLLRATGPEDVWFVGAERRAYQWDGQRLHQGEAPFAPTDAWAAPGGELWIVGDKEPGTAARTMTAARGGR